MIRGPKGPCEQVLPMSRTNPDEPSAGVRSGIDPGLFTKDPRGKGNNNGDTVCRQTTQLPQRLLGGREFRRDARENDCAK
jgi:hypothetical protein